MSLTVTIERGDIPSSQVAAANIVIQHARNQGSPNANRAAGVTVPICRTNQTQLQYERRRAAGGIEFRFTTGNLRLTLRQSVYLLNTLSNCAQKIVEAHELDHVRDNQELMQNMEREIRNHRALQDIFINPRWRPSKQFQAVQLTIQSTVEEIFRRLTRAAVRSRDTQAVYDALDRKIQQDCGASK